MKPTRIVEGRWTVIRKLDISSIVLNIEVLKATIASAKVRSKLEDVQNIYNRINIILDHLDEICNHLNIQTKTRSKRGLINGLGSIIEAITGHLDHDDLIHIKKNLKLYKLLLINKYP
ncbi:unnamed protein product [Diatraea saccharalis]|uniref:Uncharacterized protein n=1 Tax=Diatraea saccharalis TaxID=40085 RepID=A0A9N9RDX9_9NEOP|nr:unnamed protein product [Diatraea saccharalis]